MKIQTMFRAEKVPFFFALLLGALAVQYNYLASYFDDSPIIEYGWETEKVAEGDSCRYIGTVLLRNLSKGIKYDQLEFHIGWKHRVRSGTLRNPEVIAQEPASLMSKEEEFTDELLSYTLYDFQPKAVVKLQFETVQPKEELVLPGIYLSLSSHAAQMMEMGITTFLFRNKFVINLVFTILLVAVFAVYFRTLITTQPKKVYERDSQRNDDAGVHAGRDPANEGPNVGKENYSSR